MSKEYTTLDDLIAAIPESGVWTVLLRNRKQGPRFSLWPAGHPEIDRPKALCNVSSRLNGLTHQSLVEALRAKGAWSVLGEEPPHWEDMDVSDLEEKDRPLSQSGQLLAYIAKHGPQSCLSLRKQFSRSVIRNISGALSRMAKQRHLRVVAHEPDEATGRLCAVYAATGKSLERIFEPNQNALNEVHRERVEINREKIWQAIPDDPFTVPRLAELSGCHRDTVRKAVRHFKANGLIEPDHYKKSWTVWRKA